MNTLTFKIYLLSQHAQNFQNIHITKQYIHFLISDDKLGQPFLFHRSIQLKLFIFTIRCVSTFNLSLNSDERQETLRSDDLFVSRYRNNRIALKRKNHDTDIQTNYFIV